MIRLLGKLPKEFFFACSGGSDSMTMLNFLLNGGYKPVILNFDHGTDFGKESVDFLRKKCQELNLKLIVHRLTRDITKGESKENFWRKNRYEFFNNIPGAIITSHHLDDALEWWIFSSLHGDGKLIPYKNNNIIRPFLLTPKSEILKWAKKNKVEYLNDPANSDEKFMRSIVRHKIVPEALRVNPGLRKVVKKKIQKEFHTMT